MNYWTGPTDDLIDAMKSNGLRRGYVVTDPATGRVDASHPVFDSVAKAIAADTRDYRRHEGSFFEIGPESDHLALRPRPLDEARTGGGRRALLARTTPSKTSSATGSV